MTTVFYIKQANTLPVYTDTLTDASGNVINLTGATVTFHMTNMFAGNVVNATATIVNAALGQVSYSWQSGDTSIPGTYSAEWAVVFSGGSQETFPLTGYRTIEILPDISIGFPQVSGFTPLFNTLITLNRAPQPTDGRNGDYAVFPSASLWYGPKANGVWPPAISVAAPSPQGAQKPGIIAATMGPLDPTSKTTTPILNTGEVYLTAIWMPAGAVITNFNLVTGTVGSTGMTHSWFGLADSTGKQLAHTADQGSTAYPTGTAVPIALTAPYTTPVQGIYYMVASMTGTTLPFLVTSSPVGGGAANTLILAGTTGNVDTTPGTDGATTFTLPSGQLAVPYMYWT